MWQRCSLGQTWDDSTRASSANTYTWQEALQQAESNSLAGYSDWQLPNIREPHSLVAHNPSNLAINRTVFSISEGDCWSSSSCGYTLYSSSSSASIFTMAMTTSALKTKILPKLLIESYFRTIILEIPFYSTSCEVKNATGKVKRKAADNRSC